MNPEFGPGTFGRKVEDLARTPGSEMGAGAEKKVYIDPEDDTRVIAAFRDNDFIDNDDCASAFGETDEEIRQGLAESPESLKGRYYLTNILHLVSQKHFPHIFRASVEPHALVVERVGDIDDDVMPTLEEAAEMQQEFLSDFGLTLQDASDSNFVFDTERDEYVLVDLPSPWQESEGSLVMMYNRGKLLYAILERLSGHELHTALGYFERLDTLLDSELKRVNGHPSAEVFNRRQWMEELN